jgi:hypothetical protein
MASLTELGSRWKVWWLSALAGAALGCIYRLLITVQKMESALTSPAWIMTWAFLAGVPFAMGYLSVTQYLNALPKDQKPTHKWIFLPAQSVFLTMLVSVLVQWEGYICLIFAGPIMLFTSLLGGMTARQAWDKRSRRGQSTISAMILPFCLILIENQIPLPGEIRTVNTEILIHAPSQAVWDNIKSVRAISSDELPPSWINRIGFPKPIAATLSHEGIGGVRQASFTGGLVFTETVHQWKPNHDLAFSIRANTDAIPRTTLDEHVTIGGPFFDVLDGEYRLEPRPDGVLLHLSSRQRLSTHLNPYASLWTDAVMRAIQNQILIVIRKRCEKLPIHA